jgi:hypothetical protein
MAELAASSAPEDICRAAFINTADVLPALTTYPELTLCLSPDGGPLWKFDEGIKDP